MGYIAPVPHYQYMQYAEREAKKDYDPFTFIPVNRIQPLYNQDQHRQENIETGENGPGFKRMKNITGPETVSAEFLADITGKGKYINEYV
ncbi:hypothetical protein FZC84_18365 [Rossellomorea vietnamensis]|uniref:Uncharacterized protein n=1 Tax=Rossellomorea vietnamensis TaxID=218284 RepID=A0A5D4M8G4_9BACI|nr:hypothetical protein [Rossellomorea vietnamensis]TYR97643.1 hypothetical protein FZC84_18365 [Rossellomorea vietnamensis]